MILPPYRYKELLSITRKSRHLNKAIYKIKLKIESVTTKFNKQKILKGYNPTNGKLKTKRVANLRNWIILFSAT